MSSNVNTAIEYITQADIDTLSTNHAIPYGTFGEIVDIRTYRRWLPQQKRRETAYERWMRIINYNLNLVSDKHDYDYLRKEALLMLDKFSNMQADLSGRTKWVGGTTASTKDPSSQFNCSFTVINRIEAFLDAFMLLMNGCGVGYRVFYEDIAQLPNITNQNLKVTFEPYEPLPKEAREEFSYLQVIDNVAYVEVGDSKEGWVSALRTYLYIVAGQSYFELNIAKKETDIDLSSIHTITYNFNSVRPIGERINGFGGTASGYLALQEIITDIHRIVSELPGNWLRSIDCNDIVCAIAKGVVAGSSRRSALICLFNQDDTLMASSKVGLYTNPELSHKGYRSQVNITACLTEKPSLDKIKSLLETCKTEGEPGFNNYAAMVKRRENAAQKYRSGNPVEWYTNVGTNPCFAAGTMVMTREGHYPIEDLVGKVVEVHDGDDWVKIDNFRVTAEDQEVYKVTLHSGQTITATAYHTFILEDGTRKELRHLVPGDKLATNQTIIEGDLKLKSAYLKGFLVGDGTSHKDKPLLHLYFPKYCCEDRLVLSLSEVEGQRYGTYEEINPGFTTTNNGNNKMMRGLSSRRTEFLPWVTQYRQKLPEECLNWDNQSKYDFIAGVMDADGTAQDCSRSGFRYQITSINKEWLESFQLLLKSIGVESKLSDGEKRGDKYDFGENRGGVCNVKPSYRLTICQPYCIKLASLVKFERLTSFANKNVKYISKSNFAKVVSVEFSHVADEVYCCTVPTNNTFCLSVGIQVGNCHEIILSAGKSGNSVSFCNLTTLPLPNFINANGRVSYDQLADSIRLNVRSSLRQTCVDFINSEWTETQSDERLLGVSLTGCQDFFSLLGWKTGSSEINNFLGWANGIANNEADIYSKALGVPRPLLVTCIKPEGCLNAQAVRVSDQGIFTIHDLNPNIDEDLGFNELDGFTRNGLAITKSFNNGYSQVQVLTLKNGRKLISTPNHQFSINNEWVRADKITIPSKLDYQLGTYCNKVEANLIKLDMSTIDRNTIVYTLPENMTPDLSWLIGQYWANGCFTTKDRIKLHCQHKAVHDKANRIWNQVFNVNPTIIKSNDRDSYNQDFRSTLITHWFKVNGFLKTPKVKLNQIPLSIRKSSVESVIAFIAGYADGDGCFHSSTFCIDSNSEDWIRHLQEVGEAVGFSFSCIENSRRNAHSDGSIWKCHMSRCYSLGWTVDLLNKHSVKSIDKPVSISDNKNKVPFPYAVVSNVKSLEPIPTYDIEVEKEHWYYTGGILSHNTASSVFGVSSGLHWDWSPYYIRRVRMTAKDALAQTLLTQGFTAKPELYDLERLYPDTSLTGWDRLELFDKLDSSDKLDILNGCNTVVFEFPVKSYSTRTQSEVSAIEQLESLKSFAANYTDHMPSCTISVKDDEWDEVAEWINNNWDDYLTASFFSYYGAKYPLLPYEAITEEEYQRLVSLIPEYSKFVLSNGRITYKVDEDLLNRFEAKLDISTDDEELGSDCSSGACPIR